MTPALSYCTAKAFRQGIMPLVEMRPALELKAANDGLPVMRLRRVGGTDPGRGFHGAEAPALKVPSFCR
ncbi:MAG: hypothetical protein ABW026_18730 [Microvirga sp.]